MADGPSLQDFKYGQIFLWDNVEFRLVKGKLTPNIWVAVVSNKRAQSHQRVTWEIWRLVRFLLLTIFLTFPFFFCNTRHFYLIGILKVKIFCLRLVMPFYTYASFYIEDWSWLKYAQKVGNWKTIVVFYDTVWNVNFALITTSCSPHLIKYSPSLRVIIGGFSALKETFY